MYCPKCKSEFREGYFRCSKCDVDLVDEVPEPDGSGEQEGEKPLNSRLSKLLAFRTENWLITGGICLIAVSFLFRISDALRYLAQHRFEGSLDTLLGLFSIFVSVINDVMWGIFFVGFGKVIMILKKGTKYEQ